MFWVAEGAPGRDEVRRATLQRDNGRVLGVQGRVGETDTHTEVGPDLGFPIITEREDSREGKGGGRVYLGSRAPDSEGCPELGAWPGGT